MKWVYVCQIAVLLWWQPTSKTAENSFVADTLGLPFLKRRAMSLSLGEGKCRYIDILWDVERCEAHILLHSLLHLFL